MTTIDNGLDALTPQERLTLAWRSRPYAVARLDAVRISAWLRSKRGLPATEMVEIAERDLASIDAIIRQGTP